MRYFYSLIILLTTLNSFSNNHKIINQRDDVSSNVIHDVVIDNKKYLWLATNNGLNRYDGEYNHIFKPEFFKGDIQCIEIIDTTLIVSNNNKLTLINTNNYKLREIYLPKKHRRIVKLFKLSNNTLVCYSDQGGLLFFDENYKIWKIIQLKVINSVSIAEYKKSIFITQPFAGKKAIVRINLNDLNINNSSLYKNFSYYEAKITFRYNQIINIDKIGLLYTSENGVMKYNESKDTFEPIKNLEEGITDIFEYKNEKLYVIKNNYQPLIYDYKLKKYIEVVYDNKDNIEILKILRKDDNIFIATNDGLIIISDKLMSIHLEKSERTVPENKLVVRRSIVEHNDNIYFFNYESIYRLAKNSYRYDIINRAPLITYSTAIIGDDIYIGSEGRGLLKLNIQTNNVTNLVPFNSFPDSSVIGYIYVLNKNELLLGTNKGLYKYDIHNNHLMPKISYNSNNSYSQIKHINKINNEYWLSTTNGLHVLNNKLKYVKTLNKETTKNKICSDSINYTLLYNDSILWLGSYNGIQMYNLKSNSFYSNFNKKNRLSNNTVTGIFKDKRGRLWVSTFNGLNLINVSKGQVKQFHKYNGLKNDEYNFNSYLHSSNGDLYLGGINGYEKIKINEIEFPYQSAKEIQISEIIIVNTINREQEIKLYEGGDINYNANNKLLRIKFSANDYTNTHNLIYYARVIGLSNAWIDLGDLPNARLFNIPKGKYKLVLKAVDKNNSENVYYKTVNFNVSQIFYKQIWFIPAISLLTILLTVFVFYTRKKVFETREMLKQKLAIEKELQNALNKQKELNTMRSRFIALISHEYRTPLTAIQSSVDLMQLTINKEIQNKAERQTNYLNNIKNQINRLVEIINAVVTLNKSGDKFNDAIIQEVEMKSFIKETIKDFNIYDTQCIINFITTIDEDVICKIDKETFKNALNNILSNAVKYYYRDTEIDVTLNKTDTKCIISVRNLGLGIPSDEINKVFDVFYRCSNVDNIPGLGTGLPIAKEFINFNNGEITIDSYINEYVNVNISLPLHIKSDTEIV